MPGGALAGLKVLECGDFVAAPFAACILGHLGADVVKIEPPVGDSNRRRGPNLRGVPNPEVAGLHLFVDQAKRSVVIDLDAPSGRAALRSLAGAADVLIASGSAGPLRRRGLTYDALRVANPALVVTTVTPYGLFTDTDPDLPMREICDMAASGWLSMSPGALEDPNLPPLKPFGQQTHFQAALHAAVATLGAVAARERGLGGQAVDISMHAAIASQIENGLMHYTYSGRVASRLGLRIVGPWGMLRLADGLLFLGFPSHEEWLRLVRFLHDPEWAASPLFADAQVRAQNNDALLALIEDSLAGQTVEATYAAMQAERIACAPVHDMASLLANEHLRARGAFVEVPHPAAGPLVYPGPQWKFSATPWTIGRRAPLLGEHTTEVISEWSAVRKVPNMAPESFDGSRSIADSGPQAGPPNEGPRPLRAPEVAPLTGVRVLEFTWVWAGPMAGMQLAHLGADVIKVESSTRPDAVRGLPPFWEGTRGPNRSGYFNQYNQGKRSVTLNLKHSRGMELARELVRRADVVIDNFGAGAMDRIGLGYDVLRALRPDIIQISLPGLGQTGPLAKYVAYGPQQVPMIGLSSLTGYPGGESRETGLSYGDPNGALHAALAVLTALHHRDRTGDGQSIDMSQWEAALPLVAEGLLTYQMTGEQPARMGNRDQFEAPQGVSRCSGEDRWVAVSCWSDDEWRALAACIGRPDLRADAQLASREGRKTRESELEAAITAWTTERTRDEAAQTLRASGVPAHQVCTTKDVIESADLDAQGFWVEQEHAEIGMARHAGIPWRFSSTALRVRSAAPALGQHTAEVLAGVLGLSAEEIEAARAVEALD